MQIRLPLSLILMSLISCSHCIALPSISTQCGTEVVLVGTLVSFLLVFPSLSKTTINPKAMPLNFHLPLNSYIQIKVLRSHINNSQKKSRYYCVPWRV